MNGSGGELTWSCGMGARSGGGENADMKWEEMMWNGLGAW